MSKTEPPREGGLQAPERHPVDWRNPEFHDTEALNAELERVFDICHGCRRCVSLCESFPTLFDLVDESPTLELDGVDSADYEKVSDQCYMCDLCFQTKCPYVPPHPFNLDFPHLMLRARSKKFADKSGSALRRTRDRALAATDRVNGLLTIPLVDKTVTGLLGFGPARQALHAVGGIHKNAALPPFTSNNARKRLADKLLQPDDKGEAQVKAAGRTRGRVAIYATCYCNSCEPGVVEDLVAVLEHNGIETRLLKDDKCCGMPSLELGDLPSVEKMKNANIPYLHQAVQDGWDILSPIPSCVLMYKQEIPLLFPEDEAAKTVAQHIFDPFEYLWARHQAKLLNTDFAPSEDGAGKAKGGGRKIAYQVACHQRVQNLGLRTRDVLQLIPGTEVEVIERCSGHDGSYAVRTETHENSVKIARPVLRRIEQADADSLTSDCPLALRHLDHLGKPGPVAGHPVSILRQAYGI